MKKRFDLQSYYPNTDFFLTTSDNPYFLCDEWVRENTHIETELAYLYISDEMPSDETAPNEVFEVTEVQRYSRGLGVVDYRKVGHGSSIVGGIIYYELYKALVDFNHLPLYVWLEEA